MGYFPFFMDLSGVEGLIVGGGITALRKIEKMLPYGPRLTVVSPDFHQRLATLSGLTLICQTFSEELLEGKEFVIAATDDSDLNHKISDLCRQRRIPVNVVDDKAYCTFLFPALVQQGDLSIGISTGGASPSAAIYLKKQISALIPENMEELLAYLESQRETVKSVFSVESLRGAVLKQLFSASLEENRPLSDKETKSILQKFKEADPG